MGENACFPQDAQEISILEQRFRNLSEAIDMLEVAFEMIQLKIAPVLTPTIDEPDKDHNGETKVLKQFSPVTSELEFHITHIKKIQERLLATTKRIEL